MNAERWLQRPKNGCTNDQKVNTMAREDGYTGGLRNIGRRRCHDEARVISDWTIVVRSGQRLGWVMVDTGCLKFSEGHNKVVLIPCYM